MKYLFVMTLIAGCISCGERTDVVIQSSANRGGTRDTVIQKQKDRLKNALDSGFYAKKLWYYWIHGSDTMDYKLTVSETRKEGTIHLDIHHKKNMLFTEVLALIRTAMPVIKEDFDLERLDYFSFESPLYYRDFEILFSKEYQTRFGQKRIGYPELDAFLLQSEITVLLNQFLEPYDKKVRRYLVEKFQLINPHQGSLFLPDLDYSGYPDFAIHGMGLSVNLKNEKME